MPLAAHIFNALKSSKNVVFNSSHLLHWESGNYRLLTLADNGRAECVASVRDFPEMLNVLRDAGLDRAKVTVY